MLKEAAAERPVCQALVATASTASSKALSGFSEPEAADSTAACLHQLFQHGCRLNSVAEIAEQCKLTRGKMVSLLTCAGAGALEGARGLWGSLLSALLERIEFGGWRGVLLCYRCRYDETPTLTRLHQRQCKALGGSYDASQHGKVVQSEGSLHVVVADSENRVLEFAGVVPTTLTIVQNTTAECLKGVRTRLFGMGTIPWLQRMSQHFPWVLQQATVDRYAANYKAEASLLRDTMTALGGSVPGAGPDPPEGPGN